MNERYFKVEVNGNIGDCYLTEELVINYLNSFGILKDDPKILLVMNGDRIEIHGEIMRFIEDKREKK